MIAATLKMSADDDDFGDFAAVRDGARDAQRALFFWGAEAARLSRARWPLLSHLVGGKAACRLSRLMRFFRASFVASLIAMFARVGCVVRARWSLLLHAASCAVHLRLCFNGAPFSARSAHRSGFPAIAFLSSLGRS